MRSTSLILAMALAVVLAHAAHAQGLPVPKLADHVTDQSGILTPDQRAGLNVELQNYEDSTGNQFAVLIIPSLQGEVLEDYSLRVAEANKLGSAKNNNGLLMLIVTDERKIRIEVGYGLEGAIPDVTTAQIRENAITPRFRQGDYFGGIQAGLQALMQAAAGEYHAEARSKQPEGFGFAGIIIAIAIIIFVSRLFRGGGPRGGRGIGSSILPWIVASQASSWGSRGGGGSGSFGGGGWGGGGGGSFGGGGSSGGW